MVPLDYVVIIESPSIQLLRYADAYPLPRMEDLFTALSGGNTLYLSIIPLATVGQRVQRIGHH